jgi:hypothetical protein
MNSKLAIIGVILITLGATLTITSYFNVNYWQAQTFYRYIFFIDSNSSSSQYLILGNSMSLKQIEVQIHSSYQLEDHLNSTMKSTYQLGLGLNPITVTLGSGNQYVSADLQPSFSTGASAFMFQAVHVFNIPEDGIFTGNITVTNPYNYPVIWIVETTGNYLLVNNNWQTAMYLGIASVAVGAVITGISVLIRKPAIKQKETTTVP